VTGATCRCSSARRRSARVAGQGLRSEEREEIKTLRRENFEFRRANEILRSAAVFSPRNSIQTDRSERVRRGDRVRFGVEPICEALDVSASAHLRAHDWRALHAGRRGERLLELIKTPHEASYLVYGHRRMSKALPRDGGSLSRSAKACFARGDPGCSIC
jgi:hypothetical protein